MADDALPGLTKRAAEALKPFVDAAMRLEDAGLLDDVPQLYMQRLGIDLDRAQWRELLAALRESQAGAEGITGGA